jgi:hypothetical protein
MAGYLDRPGNDQADLPPAYFSLLKMNSPQKHGVHREAQNQKLKTRKDPVEANGDKRK